MYWYQKIGKKWKIHEIASLLFHEVLFFYLPVIMQNFNSSNADQIFG